MTAAPWILLLLACMGVDEAARPWSRAAARSRLESVMKDGPGGEANGKAAAEAIWDGPHSLTEAIVAVASLHDSRLEELMRSGREGDANADRFLDRLASLRLDPLIEANARVARGKELTRGRRFDEALEVLDSTKREWIADPAAYWFHRAACFFSLGRIDDFRRSAEELASLSSVPQRYQVALEGLRAAAEVLNPAALSGIAHDMKDVQRRLELGKLDQKVVELEKDVLARLDRLIEELDDKDEDSGEESSDGSGESGGQGGKKRAKGGGGGGTTPSQPAEESRLLGGTGEGEVDDRRLDDDRSWGNLPDKERERALQEVSRDFPSHYRDAVEQYFHRLAIAPATP